MQSYFIALIPDDKTKSIINEAKLSISENFGPQKFLMDPPHCTLYVSLTENLREVEKIIQNNIQNQQQINVNIGDWQIFPEDKLAGGGTTVGLNFQEQDNFPIIELQKKLVNQLNPLRNNQIPQRYQQPLPESLEESKQLYGYPFVSSSTIPNILIPHISFCSFNNPNNIKLFKDFHPITKFQIPCLLKSLALFKLHDDDSVELLRDFQLQQ